MRIAHRVRAMAFLIRPIRPDQLEPTIALAVARFREARVLSRSLEERKVIERAKGRLMALHAMTEDAAFRWLRERAMDTRRRIADVARQVLASSSQGNLVTRASVPRAVTATARR
jgi:AmiR/NasT family two-component response regulator